jgi:hypothetical protein
VLKRDDLIDLIMAHLKGQGQAGKAPQERPKGEPRGRLFLTEHEIKKRLTQDQRHLTIPKDAILSPLALDWLILKGVKIVRE